MGWFYFSISSAVNVPNPLFRIKYKNTAVKCILLPTVSKYNKNYYTAVLSHQLTLNKSGCFEVYSNLNLKIDIPISN